VLEVATFYTMFMLEPVGTTALIQVCGTTPCMLRGSGELMRVCKEKIGPKDHLSADGRFTWQEVECLGACSNAPMAQINDYYFEDLTAETMAQIIDDFAAGKTPKPGSYEGRTTSEPAGGAKTLLDPALYDGSAAKPITKLPNSDPAPAEKAPA
jgi:NADH-quinone oxidoreductase subunit E